MAGEAKQSKSARTRETILQAARHRFAEAGYEQTTLRDIAADAGIDHALINRYFGSKEGLFARTVAIDLHMPDYRAVPKTGIGAALIGHFLQRWESEPSGTALIILLKTAAANPDLAERVRQVFQTQVVPALGHVVAPSELEPRSGLVSSLLLGLALSRYILKLPPVVAMTQDQLVRFAGPALQEIVTGPGA